MLDLIERERGHALAGRGARIVAKMNSLSDKAIIRALLNAGRAGVEIDLIVRGICRVIPEIEGVSDNIHVRSIVGRNLEHARAFVFENGGQREVYLSSADWMPRNLYRRVELMFPVKDFFLNPSVMFHGINILNQPIPCPDKEILQNFPIFQYVYMNNLHGT